MQQRHQDVNLGELLSQLIVQVEQLLSAHLRLVQQELVADGKKFAARSVGIVVGGVFALVGSLFIVIALMKGLEYWLAPWLAALVVAMLLIGGGTVLALVSIKRLGRIDPVGRTLEETQETIAWLTRRQ